MSVFLRNFSLRKKFICLPLLFILSGCSALTKPDVWKTFQREESFYLTSLEQAKINLNQKTPFNLPTAAPLSEFVRVALLNNQALKAAFLEWKSALYEVTSAYSLPQPQFTYSNYIEEVETRVGPQKQAFGVMQKIPFLGKLSTKGEIAKAKALALKENYNTQKLQLIQKVKEQYYEYAYLSEAIKITDENEKLLSYFEKVIQAKYKTGEAQNQALLKTQVELGKLADKLISLRDFKKPLKARLNALLSLPSDNEISFPQKVEYSLELDLDKEKFLEKCLAQNPELKNLEYNILALEKKVKMAQLNFFPDLSTGLTYIETANGPLNVSDNGKDPLILMFQFTLPLWLNDLSAQLNQSREQLAAKKSLFIDKRNQLEADVEFILYNIKDNQRKVKLYQDALIPKSEQALKAAETSYKSGEVDFLNLIDSQRMLLNFKLDYFRARTDSAQNIAKLESILGCSLSDLLPKE